MEIPALLSDRLRRLKPTGSTSATSRPQADEPACRVCLDTGLFTGWVEHADGSREAWFNRPCPSPTCEAGRRARAAQEQARVDEIFRRATIPPAYADRRLTDFTEPSVVREVELARAEQRGLYVWGDVGVGKSSLAVAVLRERLEGGASGLFVDTPDLLDRIRRSYADDGPTQDEVIEAARTVQVLVLDDLGVEVPSDWTREKLYQIVNYRYCWRLETICTTNLPPRRLASPEVVSTNGRQRTILRLGDRTVSRLLEMCRVVRLTGPDRRQRPDGQRRD